MNIIRSIIMTFSMFSCIKVPEIEWKQENMQTALAHLPLVGAVIGLVMWGCFLLCKALMLSSLLTAVIITLIPIIISGGIHIDGFCDTADALFSRASVERKHEILKDSTVGTFAVLCLIAYFLLTVAVYADERCFENGVYIYCMIPVFSRIASAIASVHFKKYNADGLLKTFSTGAKKGLSSIIIAIFFVVFSTVAIYFDLKGFIAMCLAMAICLLYVFFMSKKEFNGMSGDISGFLLVLSELVMLISVFISQRIF